MLASKLGLSRTTAEVVVVIEEAPVPTHVFWVKANEVGRRPLLRLISVARLGLETASPPGAAAANVLAHPDAGVGTVAVGAGAEDEVRVTDDARVADDVLDADPPPQADKASARASTPGTFKDRRIGLDSHHPTGTYRERRPI